MSLDIAKLRASGAVNFNGTNTLSPEETSKRLSESDNNEFMSSECSRACMAAVMPQVNRTNASVVNLKNSIHNFGVVDKKVFRGSAPYPENFKDISEIRDSKGIKALADAGVKTVIDLRSAGAVDPEYVQVLAENGIEHINIDFNDLSKPVGRESRKDQLQNFIDAINNSEGRVYVHSSLGEDRTAAAIGFYDMMVNVKPLNKVLEDIKKYNSSLSMLLMVEEYNKSFNDQYQKILK